MEEYKIRQPGKRWKPGYVYVIDYGDGKTFKVGHTTTHPEKRLGQIAGGTVIMPMYLVMTAETDLSCGFLEQLMHMYLDEYHVRGEWFRLDFQALINIYDAMDVFADMKTYDRWYELVPADFERYIDYPTRSYGQPFFTLAEVEQNRLDEIEFVKMLDNLAI